MRGVLNFILFFVIIYDTMKRGLFVFLWYDDKRVVFLGGI